MEEMYHIRLAKVREAEKLATMARDLVESSPEWYWTPERMRRALRASDTIAPAACVGDALAGFALIRVGFEEADLDLLAVRPGRRHHGIGRALVKWLEDSVIVAGVGMMRVQVRTDRPYVQSFFNHLGYQALLDESIPGAVRMDAFYMAHDLWRPSVTREVR